MRTLTIVFFVIIFMTSFVIGLNNTFAAFASLVSKYQQKEKNLAAIIPLSTKGILNEDEELLMKKEDEIRTLPTTNLNSCAIVYCGGQAYQACCAGSIYPHDCFTPDNCLHVYCYC